MTDEDFRALQEQAHLVDELTSHTGWQVLVDYWHAETKNSKHAVLNGNVASIEKYKALTGELIGVYKVLDTPIRLNGMVEGEAKRRRELANALGDDAA